MKKIVIMKMLKDTFIKDLDHEKQLIFVQNIKRSES